MHLSRVPSQRLPGAAVAGRAAAVCLLAGLLAGAAPVPPGPVLPSGKHDWIRLDTENFTFFSNASEARTRDLARRLELFRAVLGLIYKKLEVNSPVETLVYVFRDDASLTPYKKRYNGKPVELLGLFLGRREANFVLLNSGSRSDPLDTIYHEYIHYFMNNNLPRIPLWFNEGVAECYSTFKADAETARIGLPDERHLYQLRQRPLMPLRDLFAIGHDSHDYNEGDRRGMFYSQSWALAHYLLWDKPERRSQLARFLDALARGIDPMEAFGPSFETTLEKLEAELRYHINQNRFHYTIMKFKDLKVATGARLARLSRAEALARLGDLQAHMALERAAEAEAHYREALRLDARCARAHAGLGYLRLAEDKHDEAVAHLERAVELDPDDYLPHFLLGNGLVRRHWATYRWDGGREGTPPGLQRARDLFGRAIQLRPGFAETYVSLGESYAGEAGNLAAGIRLLQAAHQMLPWRSDIVANLATLQARNGDVDAARRLVDGVLARMGDSDALKAARANLAGDHGSQAAGRELVHRQDGPPAEDSEPPPLPPEARAFRAEYSSEQYNGWVAEYNDAVARANRGDFKGAIALLEQLLPRIKSTQLAEQTSNLLEQFRRDGARLKKL